MTDKMPPVIYAVEKRLWFPFTAIDGTKYYSSDVVDGLVKALEKSINRIEGQINVGLARFGDRDLVFELEQALAEFKEIE